MNRSLFLTVSLLVLPLPAAVATPDEAEVRRRAHLFVAPFQTADPAPLKELSDLLADEFVQAGSNGQVIRGKIANLERYDRELGQINERFAHLQLTYKIESVRVRGSMAIVFGKVEIRGALRKDGARFSRDVWETLIFEKQAENWLVVHEHSTRAAALDPTQR